MAIAHECFATGLDYEHSVYRKLLGEFDLEGELIQADALTTQIRFRQLKEEGAYFLLTDKANQ